MKLIYLLPIVFASQSITDLPVFYGQTSYVASDKYLPRNKTWKHMRKDKQIANTCAEQIKQDLVDMHMFWNRFAYSAHFWTEMGSKAECNKLDNSTYVLLN